MPRFHGRSPRPDRQFCTARAKFGVARHDPGASNSATFCNEFPPTCTGEVKTRREKRGDHQTAENLGRSFACRISRGARGETTNAGHDPTTTSFTELSAVRRLPALPGRRERRNRREERDRRKIQREREKGRRNDGECASSALNAVINDSDFGSDDDVRVFDILPAFLLLDVFDGFEQTIPRRFHCFKSTDPKGREKEKKGEERERERACRFLRSGSGNVRYISRRVESPSV